MDHFLPWVGKNYNSQKKRLMILGESLYGFQDVKKWLSSATEYTLKKVVKGEIKLRFFTTITKIALDKTEVNAAEIKEFWNRVMFYEYIPESLGKQGNRPNKEQFKNGYKPFIKVLDKYKPDYILVCGLQLWNNIPNDLGNDGPFPYSWYFPTGKNKGALSTYIYHPSRYSQGGINRNSRKIFKKLFSY